MKQTPFSESLNRQILKMAPPFVVVDNAPNTYQDLKRHGLDSSGRLRISGEACRSTIYGDAAVNHAFRAWHDQFHLQKALTFSLKDETKIAHLQKSAIRGDFEKALIFADVAGQVAFYFEHRSYVSNQRAFVRDLVEKQGFSIQA